jgi:predicted DNA-binding transcriptional regulator YafY
MSQDSIQRQWLILQRIPGPRSSIDSVTLWEYLRSQGIRTSHRTVQRDLVSLAESFSIVNSQDEKPYGWHWSQDAHAFGLPQMDQATAFTYRLVQQFLQPMLPQTVLNLMRPHFKQAEEVLRRTPGGKLNAWPNKVRVAPRGVPLLSAKVKPDVLEAVYGSLLEGRRLEMDYLKRGADKRHLYVLNPQALVVAGSVMYLVAAVRDYDDVLQFALHRVHAARVLEEPARTPRGFNLDAYLGEGHLGFRLSNQKIRLKARFSRMAGVTLVETPLAADQVVVEEKDTITITALVPDTQQLRGWLFSYGDQVEVLEPAGLRQDFRRLAVRMARRHGSRR